MKAHSAALLFGVLATVAFGCRETTDYNTGSIDFDPDRPDPPEAGEIPPYEGDDPLVQEAQQRFPTGLDLHKKVIWRTCTPNGGVCHNSKEYPDLRTPANFAAAFGSFCNVQPGEATSVYDGCERPGDRLRLDGDLENKPVEIAWIEQLTGEGDPRDDGATMQSPGLHIQLTAPLSTDRDDGWGTGHFVRSFVQNGEVRDIEFATYTTTWYKVGDGSHLVGRVQDYQIDEVQNLLEVGIVEADANRNGVFGATMDRDVALLAPGSPERSYLIARIRGEMFDEVIPGSRMPLANPPLTIAEMLALFCLVEGWPEGADQTFLSGMIDYRNCSYSEDPESLNLLGNGVTWASRIRPILETNCGGCHSEAQAEGNLVLVGDGVYARLLEPSAQVTDLPLITPGEPDNSYLYLKLIGDESIQGNPMPYNPLTGEGTLSEAEIGDILTWITNGAVEDQ